MHYPTAFGVLAIFWLLLSGHLDALMLTLGLVSVLSTLWLLHRMDRVDGQVSPLYPSLQMLHFGLWLMWCVVRSNILLARRIWDPRMPIYPTWTQLETKVQTPLEKALYANAITLTPGTLTTDVCDRHFMVHSLCREGIEELRTGDMERRILRLKV